MNSHDKSTSTSTDKPKSTYQKIIKALTDHGPMTARDLAEEIKINLRLVQGVLGWIRTEHPNTIYIQNWRHEKTASRLNMNAVYALGSRPDAKRPKSMSASQKCKRWRQKQKFQIASVFHLSHKKYDRVRPTEVHLGQRP